jgi:hypothetical protein
MVLMEGQGNRRPLLGTVYSPDPAPVNCAGSVTNGACDSTRMERRPTCHSSCCREDYADQAEDDLALPPGCAIVSGLLASSAPQESFLCVL